MAENSKIICGSREYVCVAVHAGESACLVHGSSENETISAGTEYSVANHARVDRDKLSVGEIKRAVLHEATARQEMVSGGFGSNYNTK